MANSLDSKLEAARNALDDFNQMNNQAAVNGILAFINEVHAQSGGALTESEAQSLELLALQILQWL